MFQKTCKQCGTVFKTKRYPTVFCSQSCYFKFKRAEANKKRLEQIQTYDKSLGAFLKDGYIYFHKTCANCGREYITRFINGKYCCTKCHDAGTNLSRHQRRNKTLPSVLRGVVLIKKSLVDAYISKNSESRKRIMEPESAQEYLYFHTRYQKESL